MKVNEMTDVAADVSELLKALSNTNRLLLLCQLTDQERSVGDLAGLVGMQMPAVSQHLALLRREGLVKGRRDGQTIYYSIAREDVREMMHFLYRTFCGDRLQEQT